MNLINRREISDGVFFNSVRDSRFKTMKISADFIVPLSAENASANALLCGVLSHSCKDYPDFTLLSKKLSSLYGADIESSVRKFGDSQLIRISAGGLDDRYSFDGESIAEELSALLCSVIFNPNISSEAFCDSEVEQERRQLLELIDSEFNDKRIYANGRLIENMCKNEVFGIKRYGTAGKIKEVTSESLYYTWRNLLRTAKVEIMYIGGSPAEKAEAVFSDAFSGIERAPLSVETEVIYSSDKVSRVIEEMDLSQSKLVMGFRAGIAVPDFDVNAARLMTAILGGTANSKLFCNVREKQSLCYYCASRYDRMKGIIMIDSGVNGENIEKAEVGILKEIDDLKNGVISDFEIESAKKAIINSFKSVGDTVGGIEMWYLGEIFDGEFKSVDTLADEISAVTKEDVVKAANKMTLDTVYILKNK